MDSQENASTFAVLVANELHTLHARSRYKIFRILFLLTVIIGLLMYAAGSQLVKSSDSVKPHVAVVKILDPILPGSKASADQVIPSLISAFSDPNSKAVLIHINSPGGTPVQATRIYDRILRLKEEYPYKRVIVTSDDMLTSGAYLIAMAADEVYATPATIVGSIGVIMKGFGFSELIGRHGIERRVYTAGSSKSQLDPFQPVTEEDIDRHAQLLADIHQQFIDIVRAGRGTKILESEVDLFTGEYWTGTKAVSLGLVDELCDYTCAVKDKLRADLVVEYSPKSPLLRRISDAFGASLQTLVSDTDQNKILFMPN